MTREEFKAKVSMELGSMERQTWEDFLEAVWQLHLEASNHWIPVEERLPEETGWYLVATPTLNSKIDVALWDGKWFRLITITYWMPLPQLPRKDE